MPDSARPARPAAAPDDGCGLWLAPTPRPKGWRAILLDPERLLVYLVVPIANVLLYGPDPGPGWLPRTVAHYLMGLVITVTFGGLFELQYAAWGRALPRSPTPVRRVVGHLVTVAITVVVGVLLSSTIVAWIWDLPLDRLRDRMWRPSVVLSGAVVAALVLSDSLRARARRHERAAAAARVAAVRAELAALQARTDPHFLFNTLNAIASLIPDDPVAAETMLERLAAVFRYTLEAGRRATVPLADELAMVRAYLEVETVRLGDRLRWRVDAAAALAATPVPPLLIQPLVENAIRHGAQTRRGATVVAVAIAASADVLTITVEDQPADPAAAETSGSRTPSGGRSGGTGTALVELAGRLALAHGDRGRLDAGAAPPAGWRATVTLPLATPTPGPEPAP